MQSVFSLRPITGKARDWMRENIQSEPYQWLGEALVIEHRYVADIIAGMMEAGLMVNKDFSVS